MARNTNGFEDAAEVIPCKYFRSIQNESDCENALAARILAVGSNFAGAFVFSMLFNIYLYGTNRLVNVFIDIVAA